MSIAVKPSMLGVHVSQAAMPPVTSYANPGGTGNRLRYIVLTTNVAMGPTFFPADGVSLIDGAMTNACWFLNQAVPGRYLQFQFSEAQIINEAKWYQDIVAAQGTWKWQGSNDGSAWTDIGVAFTLGSATTQTHTELAANTTRYLYYRLFGVSGTTSTASWMHEIEFKISPTARTNGCLYENAGGTGNRTASIATTASSGLINAAANVTALVNGSFALSTAGSAYFNSSVAAAGHWIQFDFGTAKLIDEAAWYQDSSATHGVWKWQGSANASAWTDIGTSFTLGASDGIYPALHAELHSNATSYRYYRLLGVSGTASNLPWLPEIEFRIA